MKKNIRWALLFFIGSSLFSCKMDPNWDLDVLAPIAQTSLTPANIIPVGNISADNQGKLHYVYDSEVYVVPLDSLFNIPDTTYQYGFTSPALLTINPGTEVIFFDGYISPNISAASLTAMIVRSGGVNVKATSYAPENLTLKIEIPKAKRAGQPLVKYYNVPTMGQGNASQIEQYIDLSGYDLDLTGDNGMLGNRLKMRISATTDPLSNPFQINVGDELVNCAISLDKLKPYYAKGTVNTQEVAISSDTLKLAVMNMVKSGTVNIQDLNLKLILQNGIGVDLQAFVYQVSGKNTNLGSSVSLSHPSVNNAININRAEAYLHQNPEYVPSFREIEFNSTNSNLKSFVENLPSQIGINAKFIINPLGNISGGNDFIFYNSKTSIRLRVEAPLAFGMDNLVLVDTIAMNIDVNDGQPVKSAKIKAYVNNWFPFEAKLQVFFPGENGTGLDSLFLSQHILPGIAGNNDIVTSPTHSILEATAEGETLNRLLASKKIWFKVKLTSNPGGYVYSLYDGYKMDVKLTAQLMYGL